MMSEVYSQAPNPAQQQSHCCRGSRRHRRCGAVYLISDAGARKKRLRRAALTAPARTVTKQLATGSLTAFVIRPQRPPAPIQIHHCVGRAKSLNDWRGRVVLVNLGLPVARVPQGDAVALRTGAANGFEGFRVIAISLDRKGAAAAESFLKETGATDLSLFLDPSAATLDQCRQSGFPHRC